MNGLRYIREKHRMVIADIAEKLNISRQAISMWEQGKKPIPQKRLVELSTIFSIPMEYFLDIDEVQELEINGFFLEQKIIESEHEAEVFYNDPDGSAKSVFITEPDSALVDYSRYNESQIKKKKILNKIDNTIRGEIDPTISIYDEIEHIDIYMKLFDRFSDIVSKQNLRGLIFKVIRALEVSLDINVKKYGVLGESREYFGNISDEDEFVQRMVEVIKGEVIKK